MSQPEYTWWPWRFLALSVPVLALGGAALAANENHPKDEVLAIFFSVIAAANGYLFAMAVGDFGRSIAAIPIGALSGYAAVYIFGHPMPNAAFVAILFVIAGYSFSARLMKMLPGCLSMLFLGGAFFAFMGGALNHNRASEPEMAVFCSYPFVCGCVAASMPVENSIGAIFDAWLAGIRASLNGMVMGGLIALVLSVVVAIFVNILRSQRSEEILLGGFLIVTLSLTNYFCVQNIFTAVHRAERGREVQVENSMAGNERSDG